MPIVFVDSVIALWKSLDLSSRVQERADEIVRSDSRYAAFIHRPKHLAENFEDEKLIFFLQHYRQ